MNSNHANKIFKAYGDGTINKYMLEKLLSISSDGVSDELCDELIVDAQNASDAGVHSEHDYNTYFFAGHFVDDILDDTFGIRVSSVQKMDICNYIVSNANKENDLNDYRILIHKWLCNGLDKKAYPNIGGMTAQLPQYNVEKWIATLKKIYSSLHGKNMSREDAINRFTAQWDNDEKNNFRGWMRYFEEGTPEKYNIKSSNFKKEAFDSVSPIPMSLYMGRDERPSVSTYKKPERTEKEKQLDEAKQLKLKMRARLRSLKRLLDKYSDILTHQELGSVQDEMFALEKSINRLDVYASIEDCIIRSANRMEKMGFEEGANLLKTALENEEVINALPEPVSATPNVGATGNNAGSINAIINRLAGVSKKLKSRDTIRELASIDILLNDLGLASYFPELTDAQAKLIEAYGYASNKVESIIAKLRGSGPTAPQTTPINPPAIKPPNIVPKKEKADIGDIMGKPVGEVQRNLPLKGK